MDETRVTVFSLFGQGALDITVGQYVIERARGEGRGTVIRSVLP